MAEPQRAPAPIPQMEGGRFLIVEARFYENVGAMLHRGAVATLRAGGATYDTITVPGALESRRRRLSRSTARRRRVVPMTAWWRWAA